MFIWTLVLMPILVFVYLAYSEARTRMVSRLTNVQRTTFPNDCGSRTRRHVRWITPQELPVLLHRFENVIVVDLRSEKRLRPTLFSASHVLPASPDQLNDLLPWLPADTGVVLCGPPDLCKRLLLKIRYLTGSAPIYVLAATNPSVSLCACIVVMFSGFAFATSCAFAQRSESLSSYSSSSSSHSQPFASTNLSDVSLLNGSQNSNDGYGKSGYQKYPDYGQSWFHHLAIEGGAGFDAPVGSTSDRHTFGYNIKLGGGWNFSRRFGALIEYEFNRTGIPNSVLSAVGAPDGNTHIWGFTLDPIYYLKNDGGWGGYVTGGYGFYRRLTSFTQPINEGYGCDFYGYCYPVYGSQTLSHFSSNQGGGSIGGGLTRGVGSGGAKVYVEMRYLHVATPNSSSSHSGSKQYGGINIIPVTFGIRF
jgi:hypothetical protein